MKRLYWITPEEEVRLVKKYKIPKAYLDARREESCETGHMIDWFHSIACGLMLFVPTFALPMSLVTHNSDIEQTLFTLLGLALWLAGCITIGRYIIIPRMLRLYPDPGFILSQWKNDVEKQRRLNKQKDSPPQQKKSQKIQTQKNHPKRRRKEERVELRKNVR